PIYFLPHPISFSSIAAWFFAFIFISYRIFHVLRHLRQAILLLISFTTAFPCFGIPCGNDSCIVVPLTTATLQSQASMR
ncbi:MAG: hypothetical protein J6U66_04335, partial [Lachnospiraceae bacterium]|nr:hypothetical protein [Lachnospiraceae bacterium]